MSAHAIPPVEPAAPMRARPLAQGAGWLAREVLCSQGPQDRGFEERHDAVCVALVLAGSFHYRGSHGSALLYPGALLLGNAGGCFECGHPHGHGDRCLALHFDAADFAQIATGAGFAPRLRTPMLPPVREIAAPLARVQQGLRRRDGLATGIAAVQLVECVLGVLAGGAGVAAAPGAREQRRIVAAIRHAEENAHEPLELERLAALACMSKYHFLRSFRRALGITPHQWLLGERLRRAARALRESTTPVARIAADQGFGDLSTFNAAFRRTYGCTPGAFRRG